MLALLPQPLEVESVGGSFLAGLAGPALVALAAVVAAWIAAKTANRRQKEQLAHDLAVRSLEHIRDAIDVVVVSVHEGTKLVADFCLAIPIWEENRPLLEAALTNNDLDPGVREKVHADLVDGLDEVTNEHAAVLDQIADLIGGITRLALRLGKLHEVTKRADELREAWTDLAALLILGQGRNRSAAEVARTEAKEADADAAYSQFHLACESWLTEPREAALHPPP
jgi:hypothetical protein